MSECENEGDDVSRPLPKSREESSHQMSQGSLDRPSKGLAQEDEMMNGGCPRSMRRSLAEVNGGSIASSCPALFLNASSKKNDQLMDGG